MLSAVSNKEKPRSDSDNTTAAMSTQVFVLEEPQEDSQKTLEDMSDFIRGLDPLNQLERGA